MRVQCILEKIINKLKMNKRNTKENGCVDESLVGFFDELLMREMCTFKLVLIANIMSSQVDRVVF